MPDWVVTCVVAEFLLAVEKFLVKVAKFRVFADLRDDFAAPEPASFLQYQVGLFGQDFPHSLRSRVVRHGIPPLAHAEVMGQSNTSPKSFSTQSLSYLFYLPAVPN